MNRPTNGELTSVKTPLGNITHYEYDFMGNQTAVVDAKNNRTEYTYDGNGSVTSELIQRAVLYMTSFTINKKQTAVGDIGCQNGIRKLPRFVFEREI